MAAPSRDWSMRQSTIDLDRLILSALRRHVENKVRGAVLSSCTGRMAAMSRWGVRIEKLPYLTSYQHPSLTSFVSRTAFFCTQGCGCVRQIGQFTTRGQSLLAVPPFRAPALERSGHFFFAVNSRMVMV